ncbi:DUF3486 domain-containing protein [Desulfonema ishimotonii]|uniref:DUF3486 domain-containing protein n=1 Tax=Desulfonema ishimotonii TaxID=45657 RepID=A0A401FZV9_9BACT|nr:phage protein Gp27 family protein [Desulfonema ishimotonii]GBC62498.1 DUF3486 domain-containing protein [Desulfonema ishimotonii]
MAGTFKKFRRRSSVEVLPTEIQDQMNRLLLEGATYEEISLWLKSEGHDISRSAVGRHGKLFFEAYRNVKVFEDQARALKGEVGDGLSMEEAASKLIMQRIMEALISDPGDILEQSKIIQAFSSLQSSSVRREAVKADLKDRVKKAAAKVEKIARKGGLTEDTVSTIRREILGVTG